MIVGVSIYRILLYGHDESPYYDEYYYHIGNEPEAPSEQEFQQVCREVVEQVGTSASKIEEALQEQGYSLIRQLKDVPTFEFCPYAIVNV